MATAVSSQSGEADDNNRNSNNEGIVTFEDLQDHALREYNTNLTLTTLGPGYRVVARSLRVDSTSLDNNNNNSGYSSSSKEEEDQGNIYGYCTGFVRPAGDILHIDALKVLDENIKKGSTRPGTSTGNNNGNNVGSLGSANKGQLIGLAAILYGYSKGCTKCEVLAIDDAPQQHRRLVRHFRRMGLQTVRYVGDDFSSIPDRLVWGGCGTLMEANLSYLIDKWTPVYKHSNRETQ
jgi:hypothetical protein